MISLLKRKEKVTEQRPEQPEQSKQVSEQAEPRISRGWIAPEQSSDAD
jgi:hypothetical protein